MQNYIWNYFTIISWSCFHLPKGGKKTVLQNLFYVQMSLLLKNCEYNIIRDTMSDGKKHKPKKDRGKKNCKIIFEISILMKTCWITFRLLIHPGNYFFPFCLSISLNDFLCIVTDISTVSMRWMIEVQPNVEYKCRLYSS